MVVLASVAASVGALTPAADEPATEPKLPFIPVGMRRPRLRI